MGRDAAAQGMPGIGVQGGRPTRDRACGSDSGRFRAVRRPRIRGSRLGGRRKFSYNRGRMLRFLTSGESHGPALSVIVEGLPAGLEIDIAALDHQLWRRQLGYGRGQRMKIERDRVEVTAGLRYGRTLGSPVCCVIHNRDWPNWQRTMPVGPEPGEGATGAQRGPVTRPRPGHADLAGAAKYEVDDLRCVLERASARETAARVAAGSLARQLIERLGIRLTSHVARIGDVALDTDRGVDADEMLALPDDSPLRCVDPDVQARMVAAIDAARAAGDTLGGTFEILAAGVPPGLGSYVQWDRRLDGRLAQALMSVPAIKAVGIGIGPLVAERPGSQVHDEILRDGSGSRELGVRRPTNRAGGLEGGVTNGEPLRVSGFMKPISTLMTPLRSVDLRTFEEAPAAIERSDVCAVPAAAVVGEAMVAWVLADAVLERFGGDSMTAIARRLAETRAGLRARFRAGPESGAGSA
jgi:chorismate synthase